MKNRLSLALLSVVLLAAVPLYAQEQAPPAQNPEVEAILKNLTIHPRPTDFATAQQLALQNRDERAVMLQKSVECVQRATTMEELYDCQIEEGKSLSLIRLAYCDTSIAFPSLRQRMHQGEHAAEKGEGAIAAGKVGPTECDRALAVITGKPLPRKNQQQQQQQGMGQ